MLSDTELSLKPVSGYNTVQGSTMKYPKVLSVYAGTRWYILVYTSMYWYIPACSVDARSSREVKAGIPCSFGAGRRGFDPRQPLTHEACLLSAVGDLK